MKVIVNVQHQPADVCTRSLREAVKTREKKILRDTYYLIDANNSPSQRLTMGQTIVYAGGSTTGHTHDNMEEVYYVVSGEGEMIVGEDRYPIKSGDTLYVPPREFHTTFQSANLPLVLIWVTGRID